MVSTKINFAFMKSLARGHISKLRRAHPSADVTKMLDRLNRSVKLLDDCGGMGFRVTFASRQAMAGPARARKAKSKAAKRK